MEGDDLIENIVKNICSEVLRECKNHRIRASEEFISYYISLLRLDPNRGLTYEFLTNRENVQSFVKFVVGRLESKDDPKILTLRLQQEFRSYIKELDQTIRKFRNNKRHYPELGYFRFPDNESLRHMSTKLYPLLVDIVEQDSRNTSEGLYRKLCHYVTLASGLGNPMDREVFREVLQVLRSILNKDEIGVFPSLQNYIKQEIVGSLVDIVTGIRLYNKSCGKGGAGMADLPVLMEKALGAVRIELTQCIDQARRRSEALTHSIQKNMAIVQRNSTEWGLLINFNSQAAKERWELKRDMAAAHRQLSKTTRILLESIATLDERRIFLHHQFNQTIKHLNTIIIPTLYQAVLHIFPHFVHLATIWKEFQDDAVRLKEIYSIYKLQAEEIISLEYDISIESEPSHMQMWLDSEDEELLTTTDNPDIVIHLNTEDFSKKDLEFHGYCCWALKNTDGALIPAVIPLGVIEYKAHYYGFSSKIAANCFIRNPDLYIASTLNLARKWVHLIKFLDLEDRLKEHISIRTLIEKETKQGIELHDQEVQLDTHFQESDINYDYCWNIWEYKKALLKFIDVNKCVTRSTETNKTYQKESHHTQTYDMATSESQTKAESYGNTKRPLRFAYGLRGMKKTNQCLIDLSEPMYCNMVPHEFLNK